MTLEAVMKALAAKGSAATKKLWLKHGAREPFFGVKVADLKVLEKSLRGDQTLALKLFATGNGDAQYLAGLVADGAQMTPAQLDRWAQTASWCMVSNFPVAWVATEHPEGLAHALAWIDSPKELVASAGWRALAGIVSIRDDADLPLKQLSTLLERVPKALAKSPDEVRLSMNAFVIACGAYSLELGPKAVETARRMGKLETDMGQTACQVAEAEPRILKARRGQAVAPKRAKIRC